MNPDQQYQVQGQNVQQPQQVFTPQQPQPQTLPQDQQPSNPAPQIPDYQIENQFIRDSAAELLKNEREDPGSQDPDAVRWATEIMTNGIGSTSAASAEPSQTIGSDSGVPQMADPATVDDSVLYINRDEDKNDGSDQQNKVGQ